jgi:hypothetical protein
LTIVIHTTSAVDVNAASAVPAHARPDGVRPAIGGNDGHQVNRRGQAVDPEQHDAQPDEALPESLAALGKPFEREGLRLPHGLDAQRRALDERCQPLRVDQHRNGARLDDEGHHRAAGHDTATPAMYEKRAN